MELKYHCAGWCDEPCANNAVNLNLSAGWPNGHFSHCPVSFDLSYAIYYKPTGEECLASPSLSNFQFALKVGDEPLYFELFNQKATLLDCDYCFHGQASDGRPIKLYISGSNVFVDVISEDIPDDWG